MDGETISHYRLLKRLGSGGMGVVYSAEDTKLGRKVALKFLSPQYSRDPIALHRFEREARAASALNHPNICTIYEIDEFEGRRFIAMEMLRGMTLRDRIAGEPMPREELLECAIQVTNGLEAAHEEGIIHRDIKPANIFLTSQGYIKLLDFGLAKLASEPTKAAANATASAATLHAIVDEHLTTPGVPLGTVAYMSPEQALGEKLDTRTDLFSFGTVLYEMVTGQPPFTGNTAVALFDSILHKRPLPLVGANPELPTGFVHVLDKALEKDRRLRYQSACDLRSDLVRLKRDLELKQIAIAVALVPQDRRMIAVLPFENFGESPEHDYFVDGLTEEMISQLGRLNPQRLGVIARTSAMRYKKTDMPIAQIANELGVSCVLEGSVRRVGNRVRIAAQLIEAAHQTHLWAEIYDRLLDDLIGIQIDVADQIAKSLAVELMPEQQALIARSRAANVEAHELYLQGRYHWNKRTPEAVFTSIQYFMKAAVADPSYALAYVGMADSYAVLGFYGAMSPKDSYGKAKDYASKALEIDGQIAEAHSSLAFCLLQFDWDWAGAEHEHLQAIRLNPNCAFAHHWYGLDLTQVGRFSEARRSLQRGLEVDPFQVAMHAHLGRLSYFARNYDRSLTELRRAVELDSSYAPARYFLAMCLLARGQHNDAITELQRMVLDFPAQPIPVSGLAHALGVASRCAESRRTVEGLRQLSTKMRVSSFFVGFALAWPGNEDEVFQLFEEAYNERFSWLLYLPIEPAFDFLHGDPRFFDFTRRVDVFRPSSD